MIWRKKCIHGLLRLLAFPFLATLSFSACCSLKWSSSALRSRPGHAQIRPSNERLPRTCPLWEKMVEFSFNFWHNQTESNHSVFLVMFTICMLLSCSSQLNEYISECSFLSTFCWLLFVWSKISEESLLKKTVKAFTHSRVSSVMMMRIGLRFIPPTQLLLHMKLYRMVVNSVPTLRKRNQNKHIQFLALHYIANIAYCTALESQIHFNNLI